MILGIPIEILFHDPSLLYRIRELNGFKQTPFYPRVWLDSANLNGTVALYY